MGNCLFVLFRKNQANTADSATESKLPRFVRVNQWLDECERYEKSQAHYSVEDLKRASNSELSFLQRKAANPIEIIKVHEVATRRRNVFDQQKVAGVSPVFVRNNNEGPNWRSSNEKRAPKSYSPITRSSSTDPTSAEKKDSWSPASLPRSSCRTLDIAIEKDNASTQTAQTTIATPETERLEVKRV
ncbi:unnamed protein product, partial [Mesorhabditis spiculigera]